MIALIAAHIQGTNKAPEQMMLQLSKFLHLSAAFEYRVKLFISLFADKRNLFGLCIFFLAYPVQLTPFRELYCQAPAAFQPDLLSLRCNSKIIANQFFFVCESQKLLDNTKPKGNRTDNNKKEQHTRHTVNAQAAPKAQAYKKENIEDTHWRRVLFVASLAKIYCSFAANFRDNCRTKKEKEKKKTLAQEYFERKRISFGWLAVSVGDFLRNLRMCVCMCF